MNIINNLKEYKYIWNDVERWDGIWFYFNQQETIYSIENFNNLERKKAQKKKKNINLWAKNKPIKKKSILDVKLIIQMVLDKINSLLADLGLSFNETADILIHFKKRYIFVIKNLIIYY